MDVKPRTSKLREEVAQFGPLSAASPNGGQNRILLWSRFLFSSPFVISHGELYSYKLPLLDAFILFGKLSNLPQIAPIIMNPIS